MYFVSKKEKDGSVSLVNTSGDIKRFSPNELIRYIKEKKIEVTGVKICDDDSYEINILVPVKFSLVNTIPGKFDAELEDKKGTETIQSAPVQNVQQTKEQSVPKTPLQAYTPPTTAQAQEKTDPAQTKKENLDPKEQSDSWQKDENGWSFSFL